MNISAILNQEIIPTISKAKSSDHLKESAKKIQIIMDHLQKQGKWTEAHIKFLKKFNELEKNFSQEMKEELIAIMKEAFLLQVPSPSISEAFMKFVKNIYSGHVRESFDIAEQMSNWFDIRDASILLIEKGYVDMGLEIAARLDLWHAKKDVARSLIHLGKINEAVKLSQHIGVWHAIKDICFELIHTGHIHQALKLAEDLDAWHAQKDVCLLLIEKGEINAAIELANRLDAWHAKEDIARELRNKGLASAANRVFKSSSVLMHG